VDYATDEERVEELKKWWKENGKSVIFGVVLGLAILFGWRWWGDYQLNQSLQASTLYTQLELAIQQKKSDEATALSEQIYKKYENQTYAVYAALAMAKLRVDEKEPAKAKEHLQWALAHADSPELQHLIKLRLARVLYAIDELDEASNLISGSKGGNFASAFEELKGDIMNKKGNPEQALSAYQKAVSLLPAGSRTNPTLQYKIDDLARAQ
jgi:predicted negative regulator of RcsB-dependent stress response